MAASTRPLVWDFYRAVGSASGLGGTVEYYEESGQSIWLDSDGLITETTTVEDGHWEDTEWSEDIAIMSDDHSLLALDHPSNGVLYPGRSAVVLSLCVRYGHRRFGPQRQLESQQRQRH